jgi:creatinine amidohydrolase
VDKNYGFIAWLILGFCTVGLQAQQLSPQWEELTSPDFSRAIKKAEGVCLLPMGSVEKFGPSGPLGTNLFVDRIVVLEAVKQEYAVVFPDYIVAGTNDVSNLPGAVAYSAHLQYEMLDETVSEMARNGCTKILIVNGHSGNGGLLSDFLNGNLEKPHDYVVYTVYGPQFRIVPGMPDADKVPPAAKESKPGADGHGGEERIAALLAYRPDLVHLDRAHDESGNAGKHLSLPQGVQVGISRKAELPAGYEGDASGATVARGKALVGYAATRVVAAIRAIKADNESLKLQQEFFEERRNPNK